MADPEQIARIKIDALLEQCGWAVQDKNAANLSASRGVALRELSFKTGEPDYTLFVDGKAIGTVEAKTEGHSLIGVEEQSEKYVKGVPFGLPAWRSPLPFSYETTGTRKFLAKQQCAMAEVERRLSVVEELDAVVNANLQGTTRLRQSILQRAFEESLVSSH
jgi:type I site-specific restriction endonuclease